MRAAASALAFALLGSGCGGYRHVYGPPPKASVGAPQHDCSGSPPATPGCEHTDPAARPVRFVPAKRGGEWWVARRSRGYECRLPCTQPVAHYSQFEVVGIDRVGETVFRRSVPPLPETPQDVPIVVRPEPERGNIWLGAAAVAVGELMFFGGVGFFFSEKNPDGCGGSWSTSGTGCTLGKVGLIGGPIIAGLGGAYWGFYYRGDDLQVRAGRSF